MGQKIHPLGFRLGVTQTHSSSWFEPKRMYSRTLEEDYRIRTYLKFHLANAGISKIGIYRKLNQINLELHVSRPGVIAGKLGLGLEKLKEGLRAVLLGEALLRIHIVELAQPDFSSVLLAEFAAQQLEKRVAFRKVIKQVIQRAQKASVQGVKVQISGRLNGSEIARSEWAREGRVPLQTLRAQIDYASARAQTTYGVLGVKVWLFTGEFLSTATSDQHTL